MIVLVMTAVMRTEGQRMSMMELCIGRLMMMLAKCGTRVLLNMLFDMKRLINDRLEDRSISRSKV